MGAGWCPAVADGRSAEEVCAGGPCGRVREVSCFSTDGLGLDSHLKTLQDGRTGGGKLILSQVLSCQLSPGVFGVFGVV